ncbi:unnamed protein product, partial [Amoebophrya sp. A25]
LLRDCSGGGSSVVKCHDQSSQSDVNVVRRMQTGLDVGAVEKRSFCICPPGHETASTTSVEQTEVVETFRISTRNDAEPAGELSSMRAVANDHRLEGHTLTRLSSVVITKNYDKGTATSIEFKDTTGRGSKRSSSFVGEP